MVYARLGLFIFCLYGNFLVSMNIQELSGDGDGIQPSSTVQSNYGTFETQGKNAFIVPVSLKMEQELPLNNHQKMWPFKLCPEAYRDIECNQQRDCRARFFGLCSAGALASKGIVFSALCCAGWSSQESCTVAWVGSNGCNFLEDFIVTGLGSGTTVCLIASCLIAGCAYAPCFDKKWCTEKFCKKNKINGLQTLEIELEGKNN